MTVSLATEMMAHPARHSQEERDKAITILGDAAESAIKADARENRFCRIRNEFADRCDIGYDGLSAAEQDRFLDQVEAALALLGD